jgi:hypothetical protein
MKSFLSQVIRLLVVTKRFILQPWLTLRSDFEPVVEHHEVGHEYEAGRPELLARLSSGLEDALRTHSGDDQERSALQILAIVDGFMSDVLRKTQRQAAKGPSYPRPRPSPSYPRPRPSPTLARSNDSASSGASVCQSRNTLSRVTCSSLHWSSSSASPGVPSRQPCNPSASPVTCPTIYRPSSRRSIISDSNVTQARGFHQQRALPEHTIGTGSSAASCNDRTPERVGKRQSSAFDSATFSISERVTTHHLFSIAERANTHHHDAVSPPPPLRNFPWSSDLDTRQLSANVPGFHRYINDPNLDFSLPGMAAASPSSVPWSDLALGFGTSSFQPSPAPAGMTDAELYEYISGMAESSSGGFVSQ